MSDAFTDEAVSRLVLAYHLATPGQVEEARAAQREASGEGLDLSLAEILVDFGVITAAQRNLLRLRHMGTPKGAMGMLLHYALQRQIGGGAMGEIYLAEDILAKRSVAVKVLARRYAGDDGFMRRFQREADAAGRLIHVNIARAFSVAEDFGCHFYVMEYCEGESLDKRLQRDGFLGADEATRIVTQVARGLGYAHERGVIHRDIKPSNVMAAPDGAVKILDFGLSKHIGDDESRVRLHRVTMGTPHYMSPEQARGESQIDGRADIYSLGIMYYLCVTGDTPYHGRNATELIAQHLNQRLPDPRDVREEIPDGVVHILRRMLAKRTADRYADCRALLEDLERVGAEQDPRSAAIAEGLSSVALPAVTRAPRRQFAPRLRRPTPVPEAPPAPPRVVIEPDDEGGGGRIAEAADRAFDALVAATRRGSRRLAVWGGRAARATGRGLQRGFRSLTKRGAADADGPAQEAADTSPPGEEQDRDPGAPKA